MTSLTTRSALRYGPRVALILAILCLLLLEVSRFINTGFHGDTINFISQRQMNEQRTLDTSFQPLTSKIYQTGGSISRENKQNILPDRIVTFERADNFDYKAEMAKLNTEKVAADDPRLIELIRNYFIVPPSTLDYNLTYPDRIDHSAGQAPFIDSRLNYTEAGFFVECGGLDGESSSNTLLFERYRGWKGVLIEADPLNFQKLLAKHRKAYAINACLNIQPHPSVVTFQQARNVGKISEGHPTGKSTQVQCFPLYSILLALNQLTVDFFSLDVEGFELKVLQTIPFDKVNIRTMTVEYGHQKTGIPALKSFVQGKGYETLLQMSRDTWSVNDLIFRKKGMTN